MLTSSIYFLPCRMKYLGKRQKDWSYVITSSPLRWKIYTASSWEGIQSSMEGRHSLYLDLQNKMKSKFTVSWQIWKEIDKQVNSSISFIGNSNFMDYITLHFQVKIFSPLYSVSLDSYFKNSTGGGAAAPCPVRPCSRTSAVVDKRFVNKIGDKTAILRKYDMSTKILICRHSNVRFWKRKDTFKKKI